MDFATFIALTIICILNLHLFVTPQEIDPDQATLQTYIIHVEDAQPDNADTLYSSFMPTRSVVSSSSGEQPRILYRYHNVFSGFAARLSPRDVATMREKSGFVSARPERVYPLHTTHSTTFLGLNQNLGFWSGSSYGKSVIIGLLDTGITPDHPSFSDKGMPPPPSKWKGKCDFRGSGSCNNKLIGARFFGIGANSPADQEGHGTHTAATAGGSAVPGASIFGNANGTASGVAPMAHVAMYKVCSQEGCSESAILGGMDAAIDDGVDVLSLSLGGSSTPFFMDNIAIGAYRAIEKGIFVSCSAGNSGPLKQSVLNEAPWILTVGASTLDRKLQADAVLGDNQVLEGESAFQLPSFPGNQLELAYPGVNASNGVTGMFCSPDELTSDVRGKIVMCDYGGPILRIEKGQNVRDAGGAAMILMNQEEQGITTSAEAHVLPATQITYAGTQKLKTYFSSTRNPTATIVFKGTVIGDQSAPVVAGFSSRGPSLATPGILKPDIIGPGVNILAAWPVSVENDTRSKSTFNMISGTSMSCPHLSGVAALLKSAHPDWSPAAIKSAIMTTADEVNLGGDPIEDQTTGPADLFATGSGHVNPSRANDPGLVYDIQPGDYVPYLCGLYGDRDVSVIVQRKVNCAVEKKIAEQELNYPSFGIGLGSQAETYTRTVTNVGEASSVYDVEIVAPGGVDVAVVPTKLSFASVGQKLSYNVTFTRSSAKVGLLGQGSIKWNSGKRSVRSPIAVLFQR